MKRKTNRYGAVAQLGEHQDGILRVVGSIPTSSTSLVRWTNMSNISDLAEFRKRRQQRTSLEADNSDDAVFAFRVFQYDPELSLGLTEHDTHPVVLLTDPEKQTGLAMTLESAKALQEDLANLLDSLTK